MLPLLIGTNPLMQRRSVDFPAPDGPMMQATPPFATLKDPPFIHGGSIRLMHWGKMIIHNVCRRLNANDAAASHCVVGIDWTAPRTISDTFAITGNARPSVALVQSGMGIVTPNSVT